MKKNRVLLLLLIAVCLITACFYKFNNIFNEQKSENTSSVTYHQKDPYTTNKSSKATTENFITIKNKTSKPKLTADEGTTADLNSRNKRFAEECVRLTNAERTKRGLKELKYDDSKLNDAAMMRAQESSVSFSHTRPNGKSCFTVLRKYKVKWKVAGENIAYGQETPQEVVNCWMNSEGHRKNILTPNFETIGIGIFINNDGIIYWSQLFIG